MGVIYHHKDSDDCITVLYEVPTMYTVFSKNRAIAMQKISRITTKPIRTIFKDRERAEQLVAELNIRFDTDEFYVAILLGESLPDDE